MLCVLLGGFNFPSWPLLAQESPASAAERQEAEERYKRMTAEIEDLKTTLQSCQQRLNEQREEIRKVYDEIARATSNKDYANRDDLKRLAEKIKEVDEKRLADNEKIVEKFTSEFKRLGQTLTAAPKFNGPDTSKPPVVKSTSEPGFEYAIASGDTLSGLVGKLAKQGMKLTQKQIMDANPAVNWNKLKIGQKVFIPAPAKS